MQRRRPDTVRAYRDAFIERDLVYELDALAARAWPALTVLDLDGWRVRTAGGFTRRANSVWPRAFGDRLDLASKLGNVERHYAARGLPTVFSLGPAAQPRGLDRALAERGYRASVPVEVRTARVEDLRLGPAPPPSAGDPPADGPLRTADRGSVALLDEPTPRWLDAWSRAGGRPPEAAELAPRILARVPAPSAYALLTAAGEDVAVARGVLDGGWLGVSDVVTAPGWPRRGAAGALLAALVSWAAPRGAAQSWLAVEADNAAAVAFYRAAGYRRAYTYRYRTLAGPAAPG